jgi:23S rRNA (guanine745-N1)-methyltransferase
MLPAGERRELHGLGGREPQTLEILASAACGGAAGTLEGASFDLVLSLTARRNPPEVHRVLRPGGRLIVAVPGEDDLVEARAAVLGERVLRDRVASVRDDFAGLLAVESHRTLRATARLSPEEIRDALAATYRGARESERERRADLGTMDVTLSYDLLILQRIFQRYVRTS